MKMSQFRGVTIKAGWFDTSSQPWQISYDLLSLDLLLPQLSSGCILYYCTAYLSLTLPHSQKRTAKLLRSLKKLYITFAIFIIFYKIM